MNQAWMDALAAHENGVGVTPVSLALSGHAFRHAGTDPIGEEADPPAGLEEGTVSSPQPMHDTNRASGPVSRRDGPLDVVAGGERPPAHEMGIDFEIVDDYDWPTAGPSEPVSEPGDDETTLRLEFAQLCIAQGDRPTARRILEALPCEPSSAVSETRTRLLAQCRDASAVEE